jgi:hypothetical protein
MTKKSLAASLMLVSTFSLASPPAPTPVRNALTNPLPIPSGTTITGPVTNIDPVNRRIQIRDSAGIIQTIRIDNGVEILRNGASTPLSDLAYHDIVTVTGK